MNYLIQIIIQSNDTCDENLNLLTNNKMKLTQKRIFKCFVNCKFKKSYTHIIKIHLKMNKSSNFNKIQEQRIPLIIKFKEPVVNHSLDNPFDYQINYKN